MEIDSYLSEHKIGRQHERCCFQGVANFETPLKPECVQKIAVKEMPARWRDVKVLEGICEKNPREDRVLMMPALSFIRTVSVPDQ